MSDEKQHITNVQNRYVVPPNYHPKTRKMTIFFLTKSRYQYIPQGITFISKRKNEKKDSFYMRNEANSM
jgi:hypothetical protein